jgi:hypothetical protein
MSNAMRGEDQRSEAFFSYIPVERRISPDHPLRAMRLLTDTALAGLSRDFDKLYARGAEQLTHWPRSSSQKCCCAYHREMRDFVKIVLLASLNLAA